METIRPESNNEDKNLMTREEYRKMSPRQLRDAYAQEFGVMPGEFVDDEKIIDALVNGTDDQVFLESIIKDQEEENRLLYGRGK